MSAKEITAKIGEMVPLTDTILQLTLIPEQFIDYQPGQYLQIFWQDQALSYSIANAPLGTHKYELHIRHSRDNTVTKTMLETLARQGEVQLRLPMGNCCLTAFPDHKPLSFLAAGTGFAPVKAMIEQLLFQGDQRPCRLFWGARALNDLYMDDKVKQWQAHVAQFEYYSLIATGGQPTLVDLLLGQAFADLDRQTLVLSGPFDWVYQMRDTLVAAGVDVSHLHSDAFSFE